MQKFHSHGKLLISGEYVVLDGATALALPTRFGQTLEVEEIENLLTDIMFINDGRILLDSTMDALGEIYFELLTSGERAQKARGLRPIAESEMFGKSVMLFEGVSREYLEGLGELRIPSVADLFVAKIKEARK